jgi:signal peptidase II
MRRVSLRGQALGLAGLLLILDQGTKVLIRESLALGARLDLTPFFALVHAENRGAAFSFLAGASGWQRWFFLALALGFTLWVLRELRALGVQQRALALTYGALLGGALGNALDRAVSGAVTDFLLVHWQGHYFPAFNVADSALTLAVMALLALWWKDAHNTPAEDS